MFRSLLFFLTASCLSAQDLSLAEALRRADAHNPSLLAHRYTGRAAEALIDQAAVRPNPVLGVELENFAGTGTLRGADVVESTVQVSQAFERGGKREKRVTAARRERDVADREFAVRRAEIFAATVTAYVEVIAAQERLALSTTALALAQKTADAVALRVKSAVGSASESARARASLALARADHARAESALAQARATLDAAERSGALPPGGLIIEGTAGNTGAALALFGRPRGYRCRFYVPDSICREKTDLLAALGAEVRRVPDLPCDHPDNFQQLARRDAEATPGAWWVNQFDNLANHEAHYRTTAPEILAQAGGHVDAVVAAVGSGGTLAGLSRFFRERSPSTCVICADPEGAAMWSWFTHGHLLDIVGESVAEGIGQCRVTANVARATVDAAHRIPDAEAVAILHRLRRDEGVFVGLSAAINVAATLREARAGGPGRTLVAILCDGGARYASTVHNPAWLAARGLPTA